MQLHIIDSLTSSQTIVQEHWNDTLTLSRLVHESSDKTVYYFSRLAYGSAVIGAFWSFEMIVPRMYLILSCWVSLGRSCCHINTVNICMSLVK